MLRTPLFILLPIIYMRYLKLMILQKRTFYTFRTVPFSIFADIYYNILTIAIWYLHTVDTVDSFAFSFADGIWQCNSRDINIDTETHVVAFHFYASNRFPELFTVP